MCEKEYSPIYRQIIAPIKYSIVHPSDQKMLINKSEEKHCIFCGRNEEEISFKKKAHIFPAGLGNRIWFNANECDECNESYFSLYEDDLCNYLMLDRIFIGARKRKGFVKYKPQENGKSFIERSGVENHVSINIDKLEGRFELNLDKVNKQLQYIVNKPLPYSYVNICKAITHIGWSFLSKEKRDSYPFIVDWLLGKNKLLPLYLDIAFVPGNGFSSVIFEIREAIDSENQYSLMFRFTFGLKILTFYLPKNMDTSIVPDSDLIYIQLLENNIGFNLDKMKISTEDRVQPDQICYNFKYSEIRE